MATEVSREEQIKWQRWWREHLDSLKERTLITENGYGDALIWVSSPDSIGYRQGQIRPGELGQWDIFWELKMCGIPHAERILISGLSTVQVEAEEKRMHALPVKARSGRYVEGRVDALRTVSRIIEEGMVQLYDWTADPDFKANVLRDRIDYEDALRRDRGERAKAQAEMPKVQNCRRCNHPIEGHKLPLCGAPTKKGATCACPSPLSR